MVIWDRTAPSDRRIRRARFARYGEQVDRAASEFTDLLDELPEYLDRRAAAEQWPEDVREAAKNGWAPHADEPLLILIPYY